MSWRWNRQYQEASIWKKQEMEIARGDMEMDEAKDRRAEREFERAERSPFCPKCKLPIRQENAPPGVVLTYCTACGEGI